MNGSVTSEDIMRMRFDGRPYLYRMLEQEAAQRRRSERARRFAAKAVEFIGCAVFCAAWVAMMLWCLLNWIEPSLIPYSIWGGLAK